MTVILYYTRFCDFFFCLMPVKVCDVCHPSWANEVVRICRSSQSFHRNQITERPGTLTRRSKESLPHLWIFTQAGQQLQFSMTIICPESYISEILEMHVHCSSWSLCLKFIVPPLETSFQFMDAYIQILNLLQFENNVSY